MGGYVLDCDFFAYSQVMALGWPCGLNTTIPMSPILSSSKLERFHCCNWGKKQCVTVAGFAGETHLNP